MTNEGAEHVLGEGIADFGNQFAVCVEQGDRVERSAARRSSSALRIAAASPVSATASRAASSWMIVAKLASQRCLLKPVQLLALCSLTYVPTEMACRGPAQWSGF
jgi:hypothetical protein